MDYAALQAAVAGYLNRGDLYGMIPTFVALAEAEANRALRHPRMIARAEANVNAEVEALPDDFLELISVSLDGTDEALIGLSIEALTERKAASAQRTGKPDSYALAGAALQLFPAPDQSRPLIISYYQQIPALSAEAPANWLLSLFPDVYVYGALAHAGAYLAPDPRGLAWRALFEDAIAGAQMDALRGLWGARPTPQASNVV